ncbi:TRAP transporter small permease subunit [Planktotalea arctica]|uniref:TRAP transporter small permease subunit n=1 Tax=Planktotalea arctica TaxID=1481893 RepID=UPI000A1724A3|nr:TRAP transporter small permease subunit [Planktotalea arctica]
MTLFMRFERAMIRFSAGLALLGGAGLIFAVLLTCVSILFKLAGRLFEALFGAQWVVETLPWLRAILGEEELVSLGVAFALFAALPWVMIQRGHIKVNLFEPVFTARFNKLLDLLGDLTLAILAYLIMTRQWFLIFKKARGSNEPFVDILLQGDLEQIASRLRDAQESQILGLPLWPTYIIAELCVIAFFAVACFCVLRSARALAAPTSARAQ